MKLVSNGALVGALLTALCPLLAPPVAQAATLDWQTLSGQAPKVIGHRGAPNYLAENSLPGYELAGDLGADMVETDVQVSKDGELIVMHDGTLERTTDIAARFPPRNGGYRVADFTLAEIKQLTLLPTGSASYSHPGFTPTTDFSVPTLGEFLDTVNAYNATHGTDLGVLTELKSSYTPEVNAKVVAEMLDKGFGETGSNGAVQSFSVTNVREMSALFDAAGADVYVDLLGYGGVQTAEGWALGLNGSGTSYELLSELAGYADAVASSYSYITEDFVAAVHAAGLEIYAWTLRPTDEASAAALLADFLAWGVDGFITDNADYVNAALANSGYDVAPAPVPLPAALPMLLAGMAALGGLARRRRPALAA
ncbi:glycerophosphodiester phosphodiesterase family protein [Rhodovulum visakhapatnamense]|uniref:Glycerophosphoryl diester phosphodiesterase n=1 Tax=Rhodovulum visakhapatnamense TaxID=364297 RepID=A0A4R8FVV7_9RHOB|nr:glycerophosphodiester phosphodiesterase family protein [Rhodovulum visakhapatnamense]TDX30677.1 glycerophosphoryl diester phosphodiesterase [Rhodovulum visakhapatnamense]